MSCLLLIFWLTSAAPPEEADSSVQTNLKVYQSLGRSIGDSIAQTIARVDSPRIAVTVAPAEFRWFMDGPVSDAFRARGWKVVVPDSARYVAEFGALVMHVAYANVRRPGLFSSRVVDRSVKMSVSIRLTDRTTGGLILATERAGEFGDTVELSGIEALETPWVAATRGTLPPEGFLSGWAEPLIVIGSIAVAIYLLFTVRS